MGAGLWVKGRRRRITGPAGWLASLSLPFRKSYQRKEGRAEAMNGAREMAGLAEAWEGLSVWVRGATG